MSSRTKFVKVQNLTDHNVVYNLKEEGYARRVFRPGEVKEISPDELKKLSWSRGGAVLLQHYLSVKDESLASEFGVDVEDTPEYNWTKDDVDAALLDENTDRLLDALDFAPAGIVELIKDRAVALKIDSLDKRRLLSKKLGCDIDAMIRNNEDGQADQSTAPSANKTNKRRRANKPVVTEGGM